MRTTYLLHSPDACRAVDRLPANRGRQLLIDSLIEAYGLHLQCRVVPVVPATRAQLTSFHTLEYVDVLMSRGLKVGDSESGSEGDGEDEDTSGGDEASEALSAEDYFKYGMVHDCPPFPQLDLYVKYVAGSSLTAATVLLKASRVPNTQTVCLNWYGGRHHAAKGTAHGFCYVNDVVLAILHLRKVFRRVAYVDLDLHHGDGVENAFRYSRGVVTCSVHRSEPTFFPGSGTHSAEGAYNIPARRGLSNGTLQAILEQLVAPLVARHDPQVIVVQCGCDGLASDPAGEWNLTRDGLVAGVVGLVNKFPSASFLLLAGGGYNHPEAAKFYAALTKAVVGDKTNWDELPDHGLVEMYSGYNFHPGLEAKPGRLDENQGLVEQMRREFNLER